MGRKKLPYRTGGPSRDAGKIKSPYYCKWYELKTDQNGSREIQRSRWFKTLKEAEAFGRARTMSRSDVRNFTDTERALVVHFFSECSDRGLSPTDVFDAGLRHFNRARIHSIPIIEAFDHYKTWMVGKRRAKATKENHRSSIGRLIRATEPQRMMDSFSAIELIDIVRQHYTHPVSQGNYLKDLRAFFNWGSREGYCLPIGKAMTLSTGEKDSAVVSAEKKSTDKPPRLTVSEVETIFRVVPERYHPALALAVVAGFRPKAELPNLLWSYTEAGNFYGVDFEHKRIAIPSWWNTKLHKPRTLHDLPDLLWRILEYHRQEEGKISPCNYTNWKKQVINPIKKALGIGKLPTDLFRHTALSFQYILAGHESTMNNAGHTEDSKTFKEHYNDPSGKDEAKKFNDLFPNYPNLGKGDIS